MSIKKVDAKVDFIANEHEILFYWDKNNIWTESGLWKKNMEIFFHCRKHPLRILVCLDFHQQ